MLARASIHREAGACRQDGCWPAPAWQV